MRKIEPLNKHNKLKKEHNILKKNYKSINYEQRIIFKNKR